MSLLAITTMQEMFLLKLSTVNDQNDGESNLTIHVTSTLRVNTTKITSSALKYSLN